MWSLLLALAIGIYLCCKVQQDKNGIKKYNAKYSSEERMAEAFSKQYSISIDEENDIKDIVFSASPEIIRLYDELEQITGMMPTYPMLIWGFIAKNGKIPCELTLYNYNADNPLSNDHDLIFSRTEPWSELKITEIRQARLKFLQWYDKELKANGMEYSLMYASRRSEDEETEKSETYYYVEDAKSISECKDLYQTVVFWNPMRLHAPNLLGIV